MQKASELIPGIVAILPAVSSAPAEKHLRKCQQCGKDYPHEFRYGQGTETHCESCSEMLDRWHRLCPPIYRESDPARLPKLAEVLAWEYGERGLLLHGATGRGKTRCAWLLLHKLHFAGVKIIAFAAVSFSHEVARQFSSDAGPDRWLQRLYSAPVVFLDDVGKCRLTERGEAELFGLVENRTANGKPIIATTNFVGDSLANTMRGETGQPLVRRLREFCDCIAF